MPLSDSLEGRAKDFDMPVRATLGWLFRIRNDRGFYEAKVALLNTPQWHKTGKPYLLGQDYAEEGDFVDGAWIQFADPPEVIVSQWQPRIGDRVLVLTFGKYSFRDGRIYRLGTSYDTDAKATEEMEINGPLRVLSGGML